MTADEIRKKASIASERSAFARYEQVDWLAEIAAQLAEHNAREAQRDEKQRLRDLFAPMNGPE